MTFIFLVAILLAAGPASAKAKPKTNGKAKNPTASFNMEEVTFKSRGLTLHGQILRPKGKGPWPAILYNHGSAKDSSEAFKRLGPVFAAKGWLFFMPHRRGQGLSSEAGPYIMDQVEEARKSGGEEEAQSTLVRLLQKDHLGDQLAALKWLKGSGLAQKKRIAVQGNSFGGILTLFGAEKGDYCAAIAASPAAQSWADAPDLQKALTRSVKRADAPVFFFQAENDYDLSPSLTLSKVMKVAGKAHDIKIFPPFGDSPEEGHSFAYVGSQIWARDVFKFLEANCTK